MTRVPLLLLAAGASRRMGRPKALLPWGSQPLIQHQLATLEPLGQPLFVVLGAYGEEIRRAIGPRAVQLVENPDWPTGMNSSIAAGTRAIMAAHPDAAGLLICPVDQPLLQSDYLANMLHRFAETEATILVSASDAGWRGIPALFARQHLAELLALEGDEGAKSIVRRYRDQVEAQYAGEQLVDMDTPAAYEALWQQVNRRS